MTRTRHTQTTACHRWAFSAPVTQPLATLYSFVTTSFRDWRKQQDVGLPLMISLSVIMRNVLPHHSLQGTLAKENEL